jgi:hypothetical protein
VRASPNRCSDLAIGERAGRNGIDRPAAAGTSATNQKNQLRQLAALYIPACAPPRHATRMIFLKAIEWLSKAIRKAIRKVIRMDC